MPACVRWQDVIFEQLSWHQKSSDREHVPCKSGRVAALKLLWGVVRELARKKLLLQSSASGRIGDEKGGLRQLEVVQYQRHGALRHRQAQRPQNECQKVE